MSEQQPTRVYPPCPTWASESKRPIRERLREGALGSIAVVKSRFDRYGDTFYTSNAGTPMYVMRHPDAMYDVLVKEGSRFIKRRKDLDAFFGNGLFPASGELWRRQRRLIQPAFSNQRIHGYIPVMAAHADRMLDGWRSGEERDFGRDMMELALSIVCQTVFNHDPRGEEDEVRRVMKVFQETAGRVDLFPGWVPTLRHLRQKSAVNALDALMYGMIDARSGAVNEGDLISVLKNVRDEEGTMSRRQLRDELVTLYLAGHETTALGLSWVFHFLAGSPEKEAKLHQELDQVLGDRVPTAEDLDRLPYTSAVIMESLRLCPPFYILPRVAAEEVHAGGWDIPAGAELVLWVFLAHRDERWFPRPYDFEPERFLPDGPGAAHPHAYLPFGLGQRTCLGRHFATVELQVVIARVAQRFKLRRVPGPSMGLNTRATLGPSRPIRLKVEAR